jgi:hypothetical protein
VRGRASTLMPISESARYSAGDRVIVHPVSQALADLDGQHGTVEVVHKKGLLKGALHVRLDETDTTVGIGSRAVSPEG